MNKLSGFLIAVALSAAVSAGAVTYLTEATISSQKEEGTYKVEVRVSQLEQQDGKVVEKLLSAPKILSSPGVPASVYVGLQLGDAEYPNRENLTVDVAWPYPNESGVASCSVTVKRGETIVSKSKLQLQIDGPGRSPLVLPVQQIDPQSVEVVENKEQIYLLLQFKGKTKEDVKKTANENYGNKVYIQDLAGALIEGGMSFGVYKETGMTVHYKTRAEAERVARLLRDES